MRNFCMALALFLAACSNQQPASMVSTFNPSNFNSGNTFELVVTPSDNDNSGQQVEALDESLNVWLKKLDEFTGAREQLDYLQAQTEMLPAQIDEHNAQLTQLLIRDTESRAGYSFSEAVKLYELMVSQPQVKDHSHYDPQGNIGFCFGRAMIVHAFSRNAFVRAGNTIVSKKNIPTRKIWVTGPLDGWKHHVATMVLAKEKGVGFWVIDNYVGQVVSAARWMRVIQSDFPKAKALFNVSQANRFSEANSSQYYQVYLDDPFYHSFFSDFLRANVPLFEKGGVELSAASGSMALTTPSASADSISPLNRKAFGGTIPESLSKPIRRQK